MEVSHSLWLNNPLGLIPRGTVCPKCARFNSRDIAATVITLISGKILLIKRDHEPELGKWALPGGYLTWNETVEENARRELHEETGLTAGTMYLIGTRSDASAGDGRQTVDLFFYTAEISGELRKQAGEIADIAWFPIEELPENLAFNHSQLLKKFLPSITAEPDSPRPVVL